MNCFSKYPFLIYLLLLFSFLIQSACVSHKKVVEISNDIKRDSLGNVIDLPSKKPIKIKPEDILLSHRNMITNADKWATCYIIELNERLEKVWEPDNKMGKRDKWDENEFFVTRFGESKKNGCIRKFKKRVNKSYKWLLTSKIKYKDKDRPHNKRQDATATPGPPRKISLYRDFFFLAPTQAGALIYHELIHESGTIFHKARKFKTSTNSWNDASIELAKIKPKKAKISPYAHHTAVLKMKVLKCTEYE